MFGAKMPLLSAILLAVAAWAVPAKAELNLRARELFDRQPVINLWALRFYDMNRDGWLTMFEAQRAADAFRAIADTDRDGRVTTAEFRAAVSFLAARY